MPNQNNSNNQQNQDKKIQMFDFENLQYFFFSCFKAISIVLLI